MVKQEGPISAAGGNASGRDGGDPDPGLPVEFDARRGVLPREAPRHKTPPPASSRFASGARPRELEGHLDAGSSRGRDSNQGKKEEAWAYLGSHRVRDAGSSGAQREVQAVAGPVLGGAPCPPSAPSQTRRRRGPPLRRRRRRRPGFAPTLHGGRDELHRSRLSLRLRLGLRRRRSNGGELRERSPFDPDPAVLARRRRRCRLLPSPRAVDPGHAPGSPPGRRLGGKRHRWEQLPSRRPRPGADASDELLLATGLAARPGDVRSLPLRPRRVLPRDGRERGERGGVLRPDLLPGLGLQEGKLGGHADAAHPAAARRNPRGVGERGGDGSSTRVGGIAPGSKTRGRRGRVRQPRAVFLYARGRRQGGSEAVAGRGHRRRRRLGSSQRIGRR